ncbi:hypothetical protein MJT46_016048 [Ovis ammon polii x Ovis aries]|nr:hypothetical protein MJT46_016048 [Ovis ammon polii x Ovis aries]
MQQGVKIGPGGQRQWTWYSVLILPRTDSAAYTLRTFCRFLLHFSESKRIQIRPTREIKTISNLDKILKQQAGADGTEEVNKLPQSLPLLGHFSGSKHSLHHSSPYWRLLLYGSGSLLAQYSQSSVFSCPALVTPDEEVGPPDSGTPKH